MIKPPMSPICLICLLEKNEIETIKDILIANPCSLDHEYSSECHRPLPAYLRDDPTSYAAIAHFLGQYRSTLIQYILSRWYGTSDLTDLFSYLFQNGILNQSHFTDNLLQHFIMWSVRDSRPLNYELLDILTDYLPKEKWLNLRTPTNQNILHLIAESVMSYSHKERYFKLVVEMGVDPFPPSDKPNQTDELIDHPKSIVSRLISKNHPDLLKYIIETYRPDPIHFNESFYFRIYSSRCHPLTEALMIPPSDLIYRSHLKETFQLCRKNGLDYEQFLTRDLSRSAWCEHLMSN